MIDKLAEFTARLEPGDTAALFFAGHGVAIAGVNYLIPSDVPAVTRRRRSAGARRLDRRARPDRGAAGEIGARRAAGDRRLPRQSVSARRPAVDRQHARPRRRQTGARDLHALFRRHRPDRARSSERQRSRAQFGVHAGVRRADEAAGPASRRSRGRGARARGRTRAAKPPTTAASRRRTSRRRPITTRRSAAASAGQSAAPPGWPGRCAVRCDDGS